MLSFNTDSTVRDLGVYIDLGAATHVRKTVSCCFAALRQLRHLRRYVTYDCFRLHGVTHPLDTRLWKLRPGRAASLSTATAPVCPQRCGSSGVSASLL